MKLAFIAPDNHLELSLQGDILFLLANRASSKYIDFYKKQDRYKILDCGTAEGELVSNFNLIRKARMMKVNEIVVPDVLFDSDATLQKLKDFLWLIKKDHYSLMVVPQGNSKTDYLGCLSKTLKMTCDYQKIVVGVSKFSALKCGTREQAVDEIIKIMNLLNIHRPLHLLGNVFIDDVELYKDNTAVRSNDSCIAILSAWYGVNIERFKDRLVTSNDYFKANLNSFDITLAMHNMSYMRNLV